MPPDPRAARRAPVLLVTGGTGQVGFELQRELASLGTIEAPARSELDLSKPTSIRAAVRRIQPDVIINAGAYTSVDGAESDRDLCFAVNAEAPGVLAAEAENVGAALIHYSTDYVFDGKKKSPYVETDAVAPLNSYGESKLAGERAVENVGGSWVILRVAWVYGLWGRNFLRTVLRMASEETELRIVDDQVGSPTWSRSIAAATTQLLKQRPETARLTEWLAPLAGVYHLSPAGTTSWCGFARAIVELAARPDSPRARVVPISTEQYPTPARRPRWSVMSSAKLARSFGVALPSWEVDLARAMAGAEQDGFQLPA